MSKEDSRKMMNNVGICVAEAEGALARDDDEAVDAALCKLRDILDDCYDRNDEEPRDKVLEQMQAVGEKRYSDADEAAKQQEDDSEDHERNEEKGKVEKPRPGHCVPQD